MAGHTSEQLEAFYEEFIILNNQEKLEKLQSIGISQSYIALFEGGDDDENRGLGFIVAGLLNKYHPELTTKFLDSQKTPGDVVIDEMADGMILGFLGMALDSYETQCGP